MLTKICSRCKEEKPLSEFCKSSRQKDGLNYICKSCARIKQVNYKLRNPGKDKEYYELNKERLLEAKKKYFQDNKKDLSKKNLAWQRNNKERYKLVSRNARLKKDYGISSEEYDIMFKNQKGLCLICNKSETQLNSNNDIRPLAIDHNHKTGKIRGLLCTKCNAALGSFGDNIETLKLAIKYLEKYKG